MPLERPLTENAVHLCVDMQNLFAQDTPWRTPWMKRVLPRALVLAEAHAAQTIFTRFMPPFDAAETHGTWRRYWTKWSGLTLQNIDRRLIDLVAPLASLSPPADILDKKYNSPWFATDLEQRLAHRGCDALVITGAETDVCVLGAALGGVDRGYRIVIATDAICSSSDEMHDALIALYENRYSQQIETATVDEILEGWRAPTSAREARAASGF